MKKSKNQPFSISIWHEEPSCSCLVIEKTLNSFVGTEEITLRSENRFKVVEGVWHLKLNEVRVNIFGRNEELR